MKYFAVIFLICSLKIIGMDVVPFEPFKTYDLQKESLLDCLPSELFDKVVLSIVFSDAETFQKSDVQALANLSMTSKKYANVLQNTDFIKSVVESAVKIYGVNHEKYCFGLKNIVAFRKILSVNELVHQCMFTKQLDDVTFKVINNPYCIVDYKHKNGCTHYSHALYHSKSLMCDLLLQKGLKAAMSDTENLTKNCAALSHYAFWFDNFIKIRADVNWIDSCGFTMLTNQLLPCYFKDQDQTIQMITSLMNPEKITFSSWNKGGVVNTRLQITQGEYKGCNAFSLIKKLYCSSDKDPETQNFGKQLLQILNKL